MPPWWARRPARVLARSERLLLSPQRRSDWRAMAEAFEDDELLEWQGWTDSHASARVEAVRRGLHRSFRGFPANLTLRAPDTREYVGTYVLSWHGLDITTDEVILGWWLAARHRGKGLGTESLRLTLDAIRDRAQVVRDQVVDIRAEAMNRQMLVLSVVAAIFLPLGLLTGLLGINVGGIPGAGTPWAFWAVCGILVAILAFEIWLYRRLKLLG